MKLDCVRRCRIRVFELTLDVEHKLSELFDDALQTNRNMGKFGLNAIGFSVLFLVTILLSCGFDNEFIFTYHPFRNGFLLATTLADIFDF